MARDRHSEHSSNENASNYVLDPKRWSAVSSKIYTMKLDTNQGEVSVDKKLLVDGDKYRFQRRVAVPTISTADVTDRDSLLSEVGILIDNLAAYDAADGLSNEALIADGIAQYEAAIAANPQLETTLKKPSRTVKAIPRPIKLCVNGKGEPISELFS